MGREHIMPADRVHYRWDNSIRPVLEIEPGDVGWSCCALHHDMHHSGV